MTQDNRLRIADLANLGKEIRRRVPFPDGQERELLGVQDFDPVVAAQMEMTGAKITQNTGDKLEDARLQTEGTREALRFICPSMPEGMELEVPFLFAAAVVGDFMEELQKDGLLATHMGNRATRRTPKKPSPQPSNA